MKVRIRPYSRWLGPYQLVQDVLFGWTKRPDKYGLPESPQWVENLAERFAHSWLGGQWLRLAEWWLAWHQSRRVSVKIQPHDTWNMDETLAHIILPMLIQMRNTKQGAFSVDSEDVPEHLRPTEAEQQAYGTDGETDSRFFQRWDWIMDEMIFAFDCLTRDWEQQFYSGTIDTVCTPVDRDGDPVVDSDDPDFIGYRLDSGPNDTFEVDREGLKAMDDRINNGLRLFGKYYRGLWD